MLIISQTIAVILILIIALVVQRRLSKRFTNSTLILLISSGICIGVIGFGWIAQRALWDTLHHGIPYMWFEMNALFREHGFSLIVGIMLYCLFPGFATTLISASGGSLSQRIIRGYIAAIASLIIQNIVIFIDAEKVTANEIVFVMCTNVIVGLIAGIVIGFLNNKLMQSIGIKAQNYALSYIVCKFAKSRIIRFFIFVLIGIGLIVYCLFFYRIPRRVFLGIEKWQKISFHYVWKETAVYRTNGKKWEFPIYVASSRFLVSTSADTLDFSLWFEPTKLGDEMKTSTLLEIVTSQEPITLKEITQIRKGSPLESSSKVRTIYKQQIPKGRIRLVYRHDLIRSILFDDETPRWRNLSLEIPEGQQISLSKDSREFSDLGRNATLDSLSGEKDALVFSTDGSAVESRVGSISRLAIIIFGGGIYKMTDSLESYLQLHSIRLDGFEKSDLDCWIELPGDTNHIQINPDVIYQSWAPSDTSFEYPIIMLFLGEANGGEFLHFPNLMKKCEFVEYNFWLEGRSHRDEPPSIGDFFVTGAKGKLQVSVESYPISYGDEIHIGGEDLRIEHTPDEKITIQGKSRDVVLNGTMLTDTIWSSFPAEVQAVIIGAVLTVIGFAIRQFFFKRQRGESG